MTQDGRGKDVTPEIRQSNATFQRWVSRAYGFAAICLFALAAVEAVGWATPLVRTLLMLGIAAAGTGAWIMQAQRKCPQCGEPYGYHLRIVNANICRKCGAEFPPWRPGLEDDAGSGGAR